jgi:HEXXH motif-containing protein
MSFCLSDLLFPQTDSPLAHSQLAELLPHQFHTVPADLRAYEYLSVSTKSDIEPAPLSHQEAQDALILSLSLMKFAWSESVGYVAAVTKEIFPLALVNNRWLSASCAEYPCAILVTLNENFLASSAETIIHEASHLALYRVESLGRLTASATEKYRHPWKLALRPARGALFAAHAFLNVAHLYLKLSETARANQQTYLNEGLTNLQSVDKVVLQLETWDDLTYSGRLVCDELRRLINLLGAKYGNRVGRSGF